jgi:hypothetical protein
MSKTQSTGASTRTVSRVPRCTVVIVRDGKQVVPEVGKAFDFTAQEVADIEKSSVKALYPTEGASAGSLTSVDDGRSVSTDSEI